MCNDEYHDVHRHIPTKLVVTTCKAHPHDGWVETNRSVEHAVVATKLSLVTALQPHRGPPPQSASSTSAEGTTVLPFLGRAASTTSDTSTQVPSDLENLADLAPNAVLRSPSSVAGTRSGNIPADENLPPHQNCFAVRSKRSRSCSFSPLRSRAPSNEGRVTAARDRLFARLFHTSASLTLDGVATERVVMSLRCPLTLARIRRPVRGRRCDHIQCFDEAAYVTACRSREEKLRHKYKTNGTNTHRLVWKCPECRLETPESDLVVDDFVAHVLAHTGDGVTSVVLSHDGTWTCATADTDRSDVEHSQTIEL